MPRRKLSEYRAKKIVTETLGVSYVGWSFAAGESTELDRSSIGGYDNYVVKVDQAVKGRFKKGLVLLDVKQSDIGAAIDQLRSAGYQSFLVEPYVTHEAGSERYLSLMHDRSGYRLSWSAQGGVDIESNPESVHTLTLDDATDWEKLAKQTSISSEGLQALFDAFKRHYFVFLEINPYVSDGDSIMILDSAVEVDDAGVYFTHAWEDEDIRHPKTTNATDEELTVRHLDANSPASFNLSVLNPNGSVFLLLSGGGASVVVADEVYNQGYGQQLANYGEYSGNPNQEEAEQYTSAVLSLLLKSKASKKILFVGGAVANFTDIANTFAGVIAAIDRVAGQLHEQGVKVFVRRGGPRQEIGLAKIEACLQRHNILGAVHSPETPLTDVVAEALQEIAS
jgi:ATP-citrate lyase beta-subunit